MEALLRTVEEIRNDHKNRVRADGSAASGNWGHVGRPGKKGGSQKGGGRGFRLHQTVKKTYTSQAKMRDDAKKAYRAAKEAGNTKMMARLEKRMSRINMTQKTAKKTNAMRKGYSFVRRIDKNASRNILSDPKRGKRARESSVTKASGTNEAIRFAFPKRTVRGGDYSKGGKTAEKKAKK